MPEPDTEQRTAYTSRPDLTLAAIAAIGITAATLIHTLPLPTFRILSTTALLWLLLLTDALFRHPPQNTD